LKTYLIDVAIGGGGAFVVAASVAWAMTKLRNHLKRKREGVPATLAAE
jgi:hypothetical protein